MKYLVMVLAMAGMTACAQSNSEGTDISPAKAEQKMDDPDVVVLDVRTPDEYNTGHIENATHLDYYASDFKENVEELDKEKTYVVYCRSGGRSGKSVAIMEEMGFKNVFNLKGGIIAWKKEDKKLTK